MDDSWYCRVGDILVIQNSNNKYVHRLHCQEKFYYLLLDWSFLPVHHDTELLVAELVVLQQMAVGADILNIKIVRGKNITFDSLRMKYH